MKILLSVLMGFVLLLLCSTEGWSDDFGKGLQAYKKKDYETALREWIPIAEKGNPEAQNNLGVMYLNGEGVDPDYKTAMKWFTLAAEQSVADAQNNLGLMYGNGQGVKQDLVYAHMWWDIAASEGHEGAAANRDLSITMMTPSQLEKAQDLADKCVKKEYKGC